jgi:hypothetical protein
MAQGCHFCGVSERFFLRGCSFQKLNPSPGFITNNIFLPPVGLRISERAFVCAPTKKAGQVSEGTSVAASPTKH